MQETVQVLQPQNVLQNLLNATAFFLDNNEDALSGGYIRGAGEGGWELQAALRQAQRSAFLAQPEDIVPRDLKDILKRINAEAPECHGVQLRQVLICASACPHITYTPTAVDEAQPIQPHTVLVELLSRTAFFLDNNEDALSGGYIRGAGEGGWELQAALRQAQRSAFLAQPEDIVPRDLKDILARINAEEPVRHAAQLRQLLAFAPPPIKSIVQPFTLPPS